MLRQIKPNLPQNPETQERGTGRFEPGEKWELIGEYCLHGFMNNEVADLKYREKTEMFWIA